MLPLFREEFETLECVFPLAKLVAKDHVGLQGYYFYEGTTRFGRFFAISTICFVCRI